MNLWHAGLLCHPEPGPELVSRVVSGSQQARVFDI